MFKDMRKIKRQMTDEDSRKALLIGIDGVLGTISDNGYPYAIPVNYIFHNEKVYFHCATKGHKLDNIIRSNKVSFTVITKNDIDEKEFSTNYQSVVIFGKAKLIKPNKEILMEIIKKYSRFITEGIDYVDKSYMGTQLVEIEIDHMTGKERK